MTLAELKTRFWELYGGSALIYPQVSAMLDPVVNAGIRAMAEDSECLVKSGTIACTAGTQEYSLPEDCSKVLRVSYDEEKIKPVSKWTLQSVVQEGWDSHQGHPRHYYLDGLNRKIGLYHIPSVSTTAGGEFAIGLYYVAVPVSAAPDWEITSLPGWAHQYVLFYTLREVYRSLHSGRDLRRAHFYHMLYLHGERRLKVRSSAPIARSYEMRETEYEGRSTWPAFYPRHIEES